MSDFRLCLAGEEVRLLPERALFLQGSCTLVVADMHWGKAATFRAAGIPIPGGGTEEDLTRLDAAVGRTGARRLIVLGDLFHARAGRIATRTLAALRAWRERSARIEILLVRGNHDRHAGDPPADLRINCVNSPAFLPPFALCHEPREFEDGYTLAGHVHPGWRRLPCFLVRPRVTILPAFGSFTGTAPVFPMPEDQAFVVADGEVLSLAGES